MIHKAKMIAVPMNKIAVPVLVVAPGNVALHLIVAVPILRNAAVNLIVVIITNNAVGLVPLIQIPSVVQTMMIVVLVTMVLMPVLTMVLLEPSILASLA
jgi:hypothetical protein